MNARTAKITAGWICSLGIVALVIIGGVSLYDSVLRYL